MKKKFVVKKQKKKSEESKPNLENSPTLSPNISKTEKVEEWKTKTETGTGEISIRDLIAVSGTEMKKKRGRPKKDSTPVGSVPAAAQGSSILGSYFSGTASAGGIVNGANSSAPGSIHPAPTSQSPIPSSLVRPLVKAPFKIAAIKTGFDGFALDEDETEDLAKATLAWLEWQAARMNTQLTPGHALATALVGLATVKTLAYLGSKKKTVEKDPLGASHSPAPSELQTGFPTQAFQ